MGKSKSATHPNGIRRKSRNGQGKVLRCAPRSLRRTKNVRWLEQCTDDELKEAGITREEGVVQESKY